MKDHVFKLGRARIDSVEYKNGTGFITFSYIPTLVCDNGVNPNVEMISKSHDYYQGPAFADEYEVEFIKKPRKLT